MAVTELCTERGAMRTHGRRSRTQGLGLGGTGGPGWQQLWGLTQPCLPLTSLVVSGEAGRVPRPRGARGDLRARSRDSWASKGLIPVGSREACPQPCPCLTSDRWPGSLVRATHLPCSPLQGTPDLGGVTGHGESPGTQAAGSCVESASAVPAADPQLLLGPHRHRLPGGWAGSFLT